MSDRKQALMFIVSVLATSWAFELFIIVNDGVGNFGPLWIAALMCIPGALSLALRLVLKSGFEDVGFRVGKGRYYVYAIGIPLLLALLVGLVSAVLDIRQFSPISPGQLVKITPVLLYVLGIGLIGAFGEELGWRGFLLPKMMNGGFESPYCSCALVWATWHLPIIAFGGFYQTDNPWLMALIYSGGIVAMSFVFSELRVRSGSVWIAAIAHAAHNFFFQFAVPVLLLTVPGPHSDWGDTVAGDTGLSIAVLYIATYLILDQRSSSRLPQSQGVDGDHFASLTNGVAGRSQDPGEHTGRPLPVPAQGQTGRTRHPRDHGEHAVQQAAAADGPKSSTGVSRLSGRR